jgi:hypothetical protein
MLGFLRLSGAAATGELRATSRCRRLGVAKLGAADEAERWRAGRRVTDGAATDHTFKLSRDRSRIRALQFY